MIKKRLIKNKVIRIIPMVLAVLTLTACGTNSVKDNNTTTAKKEAVSTYVTPEVENGEIVIDSGSLSVHPLYVNYDSNGTNVQMIAVKASDGTPRLSLNTCQTCNPSPKAYFVEKDGRLVCQNCGNVFTMDSVGKTTGGCNPMNISYNVVDGNLTVKTADIDKYAGKFTTWKGPVE